MNRRVYRFIFATYGHAPGVIISVIGEIIRTLITRVYVVLILAAMVSAVAIGDFEAAKGQLLQYVIWSLIGVSVGAAAILIGTLSENKVYKGLVPGYYSKLTGKDMSFYRDSQTGYLTTLFRHFLDSGMELSRMLRGEVVRTAVSLIAPIAVLAYTSFWLGVLTLVLVIFQLAYIVWASSKANKYREKSHEIYRKINGAVADDLTNIIAFKNSGLELENLDRMKELHHHEHRMFWLRRKTVVLLDLPRNFVLTIFVGLAFWIILNSSEPTETVVGTMVLAITYMFQIFRSVTDLPDMIVSLDDRVTRLDATLGILSDEHETIKDPIKPRKFIPKSSDINLESVDFAYGDNDKTQYILRDLSLSIKAGEHVGIVGLSGAGKSTLASLIMRFDDPTAGSVKIGGFDLRDIRQSDLRKQIAYVPQEPLLFHATVKENISYGNSVVTEKKVIEAAKTAHAHDFISRLSYGYDTVVGERGVKLSGGQKQRIVIARAVLKNAKIILFDEATSALDSHSEEIIRQSLPDIIRDKTAVIIAHRLSTVAHLDRIIVIHEGRVEEMGTHDQLLASGGRYASLWERQTRIR